VAPAAPDLAPDHHDPLNALERRHVADGERNASECDKRVQQAGDEYSIFPIRMPSISLGSLRSS
jgi:hypothetical protein